MSNAKNTFDFTRQTRQVFINLINSLSLEELNTVPEGFNNNIIWNFGHIVVTPQLLAYVRTGARQDVSLIQFVESYKKGTKPSYQVSQEEVDTLKKLAVTVIDELESDYNNAVFNVISPVKTDTYGEEMTTIEEILLMSVGHDNMHLGYALAQRKALQAKK